MALKLYVSAIQVVLRVNASEPDSWTYMYGSLCCLRQSLLCSSCKKLLKIPHSPENAECHHYYCRHCITRRKPPCKYCVDEQKFEENVQIRILLQCYKRMCKYILVSGVFRHWGDCSLSSPMLKFISMVYEGATIEDNYRYINTEANGLSRKRSRSDDDGNSQSVNGRGALYSIKLHHDSKLPKVMIKREALERYMLEHCCFNSDESSDEAMVCPKVIKECMKSLKRRKTCRCGMTKWRAGKSTCTGQRCPCYVNGRPCITCRCRGCLNPMKRWIPSPDPKRVRLHRLNSPSGNAISPETYGSSNMSHDTSDETSDSESDIDSSDIKYM